MPDPCLAFYLQQKLDMKTIIHQRGNRRQMEPSQQMKISNFLSNNQVLLPLIDGIGLQSTQANEALLSCLCASFGGSPPAKHRCYPCHQILLIGIKK
jgi:hypothetical protein